jgi:hypothetical protein
MKTVLFFLLTLGTFGFLIGEPTCAATPGVETGDALKWKIEYNDTDLITKIIDPAGRTTISLPIT